MVRIDPRLPFTMFAPMRRTGPTPPPPRRPNISGLLAPGTILDKYRIEELVGTGGFGAVYRATHLLLQTTVAIKHLRADVLARDPRVVAQLLDEARWAARVQHPNVVRVFDVTQSPSLTYVVMEYLEGKSLAALIDEHGSLEWTQVVRVGIDVAEGLAAGLASGVVHRDIKPANIVLGRDGSARIVDLGLARAGDGPRTPKTSPKAGAANEASTPRGGMIGTRGYAAPEQLADAAGADHRADIYSLGVTLDEALRGRKRTNGPLADTPLGSILGRMLSRDPDNRPSYEVLLADLRAALESR